VRFALACGTDLIAEQRFAVPFGNAITSTALNIKPCYRYPVTGVLVRPAARTSATLVVLELRKHWGETGGTLRVKDREIRVRTVILL
jgi:hypothetical protein